MSWPGMPEPYHRMLPVHPRGSQGGAQRLRGRRTALAEAEALKLQACLGDLTVWKKGDCSKKAKRAPAPISTAWPPGARVAGPDAAGERQEDRRRKARQKSRAMKAAALVIKL
ncbi:MAG: hypothetical protein NTY37_12460 [Methanothrix sp.]|nr:hypothetical protein [Methanothrix sp.]